MCYAERGRGTMRNLRTIAMLGLATILMFAIDVEAKSSRDHHRRRSSSSYSIGYSTGDVRIYVSSGDPYHRRYYRYYRGGHPYYRRGGYRYYPHRYYRRYPRYYHGTGIYYRSYPYGYYRSSYYRYPYRDRYYRYGDHRRYHHRRR